MFRSLPACCSAAVAAVLTLAASSASAAVLLSVDITNPSAVTITATGAFSQMNDTSLEVVNGVELKEFFTDAIGDVAGPVSGYLAPPSANGDAYNNWSSDLAANRNLNLYSFDEHFDDLQLFSTIAPAFTGAGTLDLAGLISLLPLEGAVGDIIVAYGSYGSGAVIGQWQVVVPEPVAVTLMLLPAALIVRRRQPNG